MQVCEFCNHDRYGYIRSLDKQGHVSIQGSLDRYIQINWYGHKRAIPIEYCPMCGRSFRR